VRCEGVDVGGAGVDLDDAAGQWAGEQAEAFRYPAAPRGAVAVRGFGQVPLVGSQELVGGYEAVFG
jgi:hypothetical protein